ncbi:phage head closure protein [Pseudoclostridium thermosuccinogenes]|uniref:phage head closure protein n=1 Tax=Clostridium thermosuccinogenes TaxID=84032 RepID=UPI002FD9F09A
MNPGKLKHRITIQHRVTDTDENGYPYTEWQEFTIAWAAKRGLSGREYYVAAAVQSENDVVFTIRYSNKTSQITPEMRIIEGTDTERPYNIKSIVDRDGNKRWLEIRVSR